MERYGGGIYIGRFEFPTNKELENIIKISTLCEKLFVVIYDDTNLDREECVKFTLIERLRALAIELRDLRHINVVSAHMNENGRLKIDYDGDVKIDIVWKSQEYKNRKLILDYDGYENGKFELALEKFKVIISMSSYKNNSMFSRIITPLKKAYTIRVLFSGTESCGKSTLVKMLSMLYNTSSTYEAGRYYSTKKFGGNDMAFQVHDFYEIAKEQHILEQRALENCNEIVFFDTDAIITQHYCEHFLGEKCIELDHYIKSSSYDIIIFLEPDIKWIADSVRILKKEEIRVYHSNKLKQLYEGYGYKNKLMYVDGSYMERLNKCIEICNDLIIQNRKNY